MDAANGNEDTGERRVRKPTSVVRGGAGGKGPRKRYLACCLPYFVILHADLKELQQAVRRVKHWLARMGLHLHADKTRFTHTLTPYQGQAGFDFLGFSIRQEPGENVSRGQSGQGHAPGGKTIITPFTHRRAPQGVKTIISPSQEASKRHLAVIEHRLPQLQTAPQAWVIAELNPLIMGWAA